jgi:hypothetical protein
MSPKFTADTRHFERDAHEPLHDDCFVDWRCGNRRGYAPGGTGPSRLLMPLGPYNDGENIRR